MIVRQLRTKTSDHKLLLLEYQPKHSRKSHYFKFELMWLVDDRWKEVVIQNWEVPLQGSPSFALCKKFLHCGKALKNWHKENFGNIDVRLTQIEQELANLQIQFQEDLNSKSGVDDKKLQLKQQLLEYDSKLLEIKHIK